ncbi:MAG: sensor histidine kinase [Candidatus Thiodiazotropha sp. (ex Epidulcina cf. delphinae)]|nr:sensor histidine kinase [Candidatus Thiodiazotropha sp. (ex Epidulcina cf. delphinae)]
MQQSERQAERKRAPLPVGKVVFLPNFCAIRAVFAVVVIGELLAILLTLAAVERLADFFDALSPISLLVQWIGLCSAGLLCLLREHLCRVGNQWAGLVAFLVLIGMTLLVLFLVAWLDSGLALAALPEDPDGLLWRSLGVSAIVGVLVLHYLYLQHLWRRQEEAENSARLQALYSRIRPHFLFNSMNTIASLTRSDPKLAEEVVEDLADLFRVSLGDAGRPSTLGRELELAHQYLSIERYRLGERLTLVWDLNDLPEQAMIPPLILQPLLENAVYHGIEPAADGGTITITGYYRRKRINLSIRNTLPGAGESSHRQGNRLALENIRARLAGVFDMEASLTESNVEGDHQVRLVIPHPWWEY